MPFKKGQTPHNFKDLTGQKYNMLTVISLHEKVDGKVYWKCMCDCGKETILDTGSLKHATKSCGCLKHIDRFADLSGYENEDIVVLSFSQKRNGAIYWNCRCKHCGEVSVKEATNIKKGLATCKCVHYDRVSEARSKKGRNTEIYSKWIGMKTRCFNNNEKSYIHYGGRGITVCQEWLDFDNFYEWSLANGYKKGYSIERKNVDENYCPENCCWIPLIEQAKNKRNTLYAELNGETKRLNEWCEIFGLNYKTVYNRINKCGMAPEQALTYKGKRGK